MSKRLTDEELQAIRERAKKVTVGEWRFVPINDSLEYFVVGEVGNEAVASGVFMLNDAAFIAHARQDIPKLLAEIERLRNAISWGVSCSGCSNQLAEEWEIVRGSFVCRECIEYGGDSE